MRSIQTASSLQPFEQPQSTATRPPASGFRDLPIAGVLFDLDGTLVDSAPDLTGAVNRMRLRRGLAALPYLQLRPFASHGAAGLLGAGFAMDSQHPNYVAMRDEFLDDYQSHATDESRLFEGVQSVLDELSARGFAWGIVTNKHTRFTEVVVQALGLHRQAHVVVSGDTTAHAKPHAEPMIYAAERLALACDQLVYVGDDIRDIQAARAAGFAGAIAARYGYGDPDSIPQWGADAVLECIQDLMPLLPKTAIVR